MTKKDLAEWLGVNGIGVVLGSLDLPEAFIRSFQDWCTAQPSQNNFWGVNRQQMQAGTTQTTGPVSVHTGYYGQMMASNPGLLSSQNLSQLQGVAQQGNQGGAFHQQGQLTLHQGYQLIQNSLNQQIFGTGLAAWLPPFNYDVIGGEDELLERLYALSAVERILVGINLDED